MRVGVWVSLCAGVIGLSLGASSTARALPLAPGLEGNCQFAGCDISYNAANGHYYAYVPTGATPASWAEARDAAAGSNLGAGTVGYLAVVTSAVENDFIVNEILPLPAALNKRLVWLGGLQNDTPTKSLPPDAGWQWLRPEQWDYTNWAPGEPNDEGVAGGDERYLTMWVRYFLSGVDYRGTWNDENATSQSSAASMGFIVEYEASGTPVPEPAAALLALLGGALVARRSRKS
jgi:hypothetical protein